MSKSIRIFILSLFILSFGLVSISSVLAQEEISPVEITEEEVAEAVSLDEDVQPEDLEVKEPRILPDSPFYFLKNWGRQIRVFFTFSPLSKAKLRLKFANEKILEAKKLAELKKEPRIIEKTLENFQEDLEKIKERAENLKQRVEAGELEKFAEKLLDQQLLHQRILEKLESQVPPEVFQKIKEHRERHLERFAEVMGKVEEKFPEKLGEALEKQKGSQFKNFKNLERLIEIEEKVPEEAKEAIRKAQENALKRLQEDLEKMSPEDQEKFKDYLEKIGGVKEKHLEILENLKSEIMKVPEAPQILELKEKLETGKAKIIKRVKEKLEKLNCPLWIPPAPGFCKEGRIIIERDPQGCPLPPKCIIPGEIEIPEKPEEPQACITLWDPVCGKDGKTYSNACFAKLTGVEIAYKGKCKEAECETDADCPQLRCGPAGTISARCIGVKAKCLEGKCQIESISTPLIEKLPE